MPRARILFVDIETSPNIGYTWGRWEQNVIAFKKEFEILSFAYKYLAEKQVYCVTVEGKRGDYALCKQLQSVLNSADIVIAHNGDSFDLKKINARLVFHELEPCKIPTTIDTKKVAKRYFGFNSNALNELGEYLKLGHKVKHEGINLWLKCMAGDSKAWAKMEHYNKRDVVLLEKVYIRLRPWIKNHPNIAKIEMGDGICPNCGSDDVMKRGLRATHASLQQQYWCRKCSSWFLGKFKKAT